MNINDPEFLTAKQLALAILALPEEKQNFKIVYYDDC